MAGQRSDYRSGEVRRTTADDFGGGGTSRGQDSEAPRNAAERRQWLRREYNSYVMPHKDDPASWERAEKVYKIVDIDADDGGLTQEEKDERAWLAKREKELNERGQKIMLGLGLAITGWLSYTIYKTATMAIPAHPAHGVEIGALCELRLALNGQKYAEPVVIGLFTQRAPYASENFHRLVTGSGGHGHTLAGTPIFRVEHGSGIYGGTMRDDARGGVVVLPAKEGTDAPPAALRSLPKEDPELPPFKWAVVSCARAFQRNSGHNSVFGILHIDNPHHIGATECAACGDIGTQRAKGFVDRWLFGTYTHTQQEDLDPTIDGAYVFGTVLRGQDVISHLIENAKGLAPMYRPTVQGHPARVEIVSCRELEMDAAAKGRLLPPERPGEGQAAHA